MSLPLDEHEIEKRRPLWIVLSELWLDTELAEDDLLRIARVMAESDLSLDELRQVYLVEVAPVVSPNLWAVAGVWNEFDQEWLCSKILENLRSRPRLAKFRAWFPITRMMMLYATEHHWEKLVKLVREMRSEPGKSLPSSQP